MDAVVAEDVAAAEAAGVAVRPAEARGAAGAARATERCTTNPLALTRGAGVDI